MGFTNLLDVLHSHIDLIQLRIIADRDLEHVHDVGVVQRAQDGDLAQCGDGDAVVALIGRGAELFEGDDARGWGVARSVDDAVCLDGVRCQWFGFWDGSNGCRDALTSFAELVELLV